MLDKIDFATGLLGVPGGIRTPNLMGRNHLRYPLRHRHLVRRVGLEPTIFTL